MDNLNLYNLRCIDPSQKVEKISFPFTAPATGFIYCRRIDNGITDFFINGTRISNVNGYYYLGVTPFPLLKGQKATIKGGDLEATFARCFI